MRTVSIVNTTVTKSALKPVTTKITIKREREEQDITLGTQSGSMYTMSIVLCKLFFLGSQGHGMGFPVARVKARSTEASRPGTPPAHAVHDA